MYIKIQSVSLCSKGDQHCAPGCVTEVTSWFQGTTSTPSPRHTSVPTRSRTYRAYRATSPIPSTPRKLPSYPRLQTEVRLLPAAQNQQPEQTAGHSTAPVMLQCFSLPLVSILQRNITGPFRSTRLSSRWPEASSPKCAPLLTQAHRTLTWGVFPKWTFLFCSLRLMCCSIRQRSASDNQVCLSFRGDCPIRWTQEYLNRLCYVEASCMFFLCVTRSACGSGN